MPTLGYWRTRCYAQPIRLMLEYLGVEFEDVKYQVGEGPEFNKDCWYTVKNTLGLAFPNLPYYIDGDVKLTQSMTILRYLARKHELMGQTEDEKIACELMLETGRDFREGVVFTAYNKEYEIIKEEYFKKAEGDLDSFEKFIGKHPWFAGKNITVCDFPMYEFLDQLQIMKPGILNKYPRLLSFVERFENLPKIKSYMNSDRFQRRPVNNPYYGFIGK